MRWIVIDGPIGAGKSTQTRLLVDALGSTGRPVLATRGLWGAGAGDLQRRVRQVLLHESFPADLPAAERALAVLAMRLTLDEGQRFQDEARDGVVVQNRGLASVLAWWGEAADDLERALRESFEAIHRRHGLVHVLLLPDDPAWARERRTADSVRTPNRAVARHLEPDHHARACARFAAAATLPGDVCPLTVTREEDERAVHARVLHVLGLSATRRAGDC